MKKLLLGQDPSVLRKVPEEESHLLHKGVVTPYCIMREHAEQMGIHLRIISSWRSYEKQKEIWDKKASGQTKILNSKGRTIDLSKLSESEIQEAILNWSALPGSSRHHMGTDFDVYDARVISAEKVQLIPEEYEVDGEMELLGAWLENFLNSDENPGFFRPYSSDRPLTGKGYQNEPWHLSFAPIAENIMKYFDVNDFTYALKQNPPLCWQSSEAQVQKFADQYILNYQAPEPSKKTFGTITQSPLIEKMNKEIIGYSRNNLPIEIYATPNYSTISKDQDSLYNEYESLDKILILAGQHGDEVEGVQILSRALRSKRQINLLPPALAVLLQANPDGTINGTRANEFGVDLNRNWPTKNWKSQTVDIKQTQDHLRLPYLTSGAYANSEPETQALHNWILANQPDLIISLHSPLGCIDLNGESELQDKIATLLQKISGLEITRGVGYPTPGSLGTWCEENNIALITLELESLPREELYQKWQPFFEEFLRLSGKHLWY